MKLKLYEIILMQQTKIVMRVGAFDRYDAEEKWKKGSASTISTEDYGTRIVEDWKDVTP